MYQILNNARRQVFLNVLSVWTNKWPNVVPIYAVSSLTYREHERGVKAMCNISDWPCIFVSAQLSDLDV